MLKKDIEYQIHERKTLDDIKQLPFSATLLALTDCYVKYITDNLNLICTLSGRQRVKEYVATCIASAIDKFNIDKNSYPTDVEKQGFIKRKMAIQKKLEELDKRCVKTLGKLASTTH